MRKLIFLIGNSGTGKDTVAKYMNYTHNWHKVASYTTRPRREGEHQCDEHIFMRWGAAANSPDFWAAQHDLHIFAKTYYGGHHYWVTQEQLLQVPSVRMPEANASMAEKRKPDEDRPLLWRESPAIYPTLYIIDERGLIDILLDVERSKWMCNTFDWDVWFLLRHERDIRECVEASRIERDKDRVDDRNKLMQILTRIGKMPRMITNYGSREEMYSVLDNLNKSHF